MIMRKRKMGRKIGRKLTSPITLNAIPMRAHFKQGAFTPLTSPPPKHLPSVSIICIPDQKEDEPSKSG